MSIYSKFHGMHSLSWRSVVALIFLINTTIFFLCKSESTALYIISIHLMPFWNMFLCHRVSSLIQCNTKRKTIQFIQWNPFAMNICQCICWHNWFGGITQLNWCNSNGWYFSTVWLPILHIIRNDIREMVSIQLSQLTNHSLLPYSFVIRYY